MTPPGAASTMESRSRASFLPSSRESPGPARSPAGAWVGVLSPSNTTTHLNSHSSPIKDAYQALKSTERISKSYLPSLATSCENMASDHERIMEKTQKIQIVYGGPTNLCQHSTTDLARGIMMNKRKQSVPSKARSFKQSKITSSFFAFNLSPTSR